MHDVGGDVAWTIWVEWAKCRCEFRNWTRCAHPLHIYSRLVYAMLHLWDYCARWALKLTPAVNALLSVHLLYVISKWLVSFIWNKVNTFIIFKILSSPRVSNLIQMHGSQTFWLTNTNGTLIPRYFKRSKTSKSVTKVALNLYLIYIINSGQKTGIWAQKWLKWHSKSCIFPNNWQN